MKEKIDELEKENFKALLLEIGADRLEDRLNIIEVFLDTEEHVSIEQLCELLRKRGYKYDQEFVQKCMDDMVRLGFAQKKNFEGKPLLYEHRHLGKHHDHLICTKCGKIIEFKDDNLELLQKRIAQRYGFHMLQHRMEIYGLCHSCLSKRKPLMPLTLAKEGEKLIIRDIIGGRGIRQRLISMGIRIGDEVEIISNTGAGRLIIACGNTRFALGRGVANKILVSLT
ncbi:MAG: Fur family transcriptional regulator [Deltaproteobacteria bacterium]|nr:MAG: Fur family transcriptional regulator [Deltaproteobacteria bacterium]